MDCCNDFPISCAPKAPGGCCPPHPPCPPRPCPAPTVKGGTSMYIGARYVPIFADPVEWDNDREFEPLMIVVHNGDCYTSKCYVPKGAELPEYPETQNRYWVKTSDYNAQFADLKKTVNDLSNLVNKFQQDNEKFTELINSWNETMNTWTGTMETWAETLKSFTEKVTALEGDLQQEIADRKAADAAEQDSREKADTALGERIDAEQSRAASVEKDLQTQITSNDNDIAALQAHDKEQDKNITDNATNIAANAQELAKHAEHLTELDAQQDAQNGRIAKLEDDTQHLRQDLTEDEAKIAANADHITEVEGQLRRTYLADTEPEKFRTGDLWFDFE